MQIFRVTYVRTAYMEIEIAAQDSREAEARFEQLAAAEPFACDYGSTLADPRYRIVDVVPVDSQVVASPQSADPIPIQPELDYVVEHLPFSNAA